MKPETIYKSLEYLPDEYLDSAYSAIENRGRRTPLRRALLIAACVALAVVMVVLPIGMFLQKSLAEPVTELSLREFTADEIAGMFNSHVLDSTTKYNMTYVPSSEFLPLNPLLEGEYLQIYEETPAGKERNLQEFEDFVSACLLFCDAIELPLPSYTERICDLDENQSGYKLILRGNYTNGNGFNITQTATTNCFFFDLAFDEQLTEIQGIELNGKQIVIDYTQSDAEIIASLQDAQKTLYTLFGESFTDAKVIRTDSGSGDHTIGTLKVYYYNEADHPLNQFREIPCSDYIELFFSNVQAYNENIAETNFLPSSIISYTQFRTESPIATEKAKAISLAKAEEYLTKGYVFQGRHACSACERDPEAVDFADYDFVSMEYFMEGSAYANQNQPRTLFPCYVFYKYIGKAENGNLTYAYTYVPAIEVSGLEEYFQEQSDRYHSQSAVTTANSSLLSTAK